MAITCARLLARPETARWRAFGRAALACALAAAACQRDGDGARAPAPPGSSAQQVHSSPGHAMTITADQLRTWSEELCTSPGLDLAAAVRVLGVPGTLVKKGADYARLEPPPPGTSEFELTLETLGDNRGKLAYIDIALAGASITRGELDRRFDAGKALPRVDYNRPHAVSYGLELPGAPFRVTLVAKFTDEPGAASAAASITLRRDVVKPQ
jgi:hypothetical protein